MEARQSADDQRKDLERICLATPDFSSLISPVHPDVVVWDAIPLLLYSRWCSVHWNTKQVVKATRTIYVCVCVLNPWGSSVERSCWCRRRM